MAIQPIAAHTGDGSASTPLLHGIEAATQSWEAGAPLVNSSGKLAEDTSDPTAIVGIAVQDATGVTDTDVPFVPALPNVTFEASVDNAPSGGNAPGTGTCLQAQVWTKYGLAEDAATGNYYINIEDTTGPVVVVTGLVDAAATVQGRVKFKFLNAISFMA